MPVCEQLQNNRLKSIPFEIADIGTLEELNVEGNPKLDMVQYSSALLCTALHRGVHRYSHCM